MNNQPQININLNRPLNCNLNGNRKQFHKEKYDRAVKEAFRVSEDDVQKLVSQLKPANEGDEEFFESCMC